MPRTLYITDLDGTLLGSDTTVSAASVSMLNEAIERGALISVATARTPATVSSLLGDIHFKVPLVVMTGAALWNQRTGEYTEVQHFSSEKVKEVINAYRVDARGSAFLYTLRKREGGKDLMEIYHIGSMNTVEHAFMNERIGNPFKRFFVPDSGESSLPPRIDNGVLFFGMNPDSVARGIYSRLERIEGINPMIYHDWHGDEVASIEAFPAGATKAQAIRRLANRLEVERIVAFGDNRNDLSMLAIADRSVAVTNALDEVKEASDVVIGSNDSDAVARYILDDFAKT